MERRYLKELLYTTKEYIEITKEIIKDNFGELNETRSYYMEEIYKIGDIVEVESEVNFTRKYLFMIVDIKPVGILNGRKLVYYCYRIREGNPKIFENKYNTGRVPKDKRIIKDYLSYLYNRADFERCNTRKVGRFYNIGNNIIKYISREEEIYYKMNK